MVPSLSEIQLSSAIVPTSGFVGVRNTVVPRSVSAPVLEFHVMGIGVTNAPSLRQIEERARRLARDMRHVGFVSEGDQLVVRAADGFGWAVRPPATSSSGSFPEQVTVEQFRGALIHPGGVSAFRSLDTDIIGALVDQQSLQTRWRDEWEHSGDGRPGRARGSSTRRSISSAATVLAPGFGPSPKKPV